MKKINIWALSLFLLGVIISLIGWNLLGLNGGYLVIWVAYPIILVSIILFIIGIFIKPKKSKR